MQGRESSGVRCRRLGVAAVLLLSASAQSIGAVPAAPAEPLPPELRVATIGYRLALANAQRCARTAPLTGLLLHDLSAYDEAARPQVAARYGLGDGMGVLGVVVGSAGSEAGLTAGDEIEEVAGKPLADLDLPAGGSRATYDRVEAFTKSLTAQLERGPVTLTVRRGKAVRQMILARRNGCAAAVALVPGSKPDAWSDQNYAAVTQGLARVAGDDELAFALAHEMAHIVLGHAAQRHGPLVGIGIGGERSRNREQAADRLGIVMTLAAGYDESGAESLLERFARTNPLALSLTHSPVRTRLAQIREQAAAFLTHPP
jgi:hypothetical protein